MFQNYSSLIPASTVSLHACSGNKPVVAGLIAMHYLNKSLEDIDGEIWKDLIGYEGVYKVSNFGRVKSADRLIVYATGAHRPTKGGILFQRQPKNKYLLVGLWLNNKEKKSLVHRLVAQAFIPNPEGKLYVNHRDGNILNNHVSNLEWVTAKENTRHLIEVLGFNFKTMSKS